MTNEEVFRRYGTDTTIVEQELGFMLQEYRERHGGGPGTLPPVNTVSFVKKFMKEETYLDTDWAEEVVNRKIEKTVVCDAEYRMVT